MNTVHLNNSYMSGWSIANSTTSANDKVKKESKKIVWTEAKDAQLSRYVREYGENNWQAIANCMTGVTSQQCKYHWQRVLNPAINHDRWSEEEDEKLKELVHQIGEKWTSIAAQIPGRTDSQCRQRYTRSLQANIKKGTWEKEEDDRLKAAVERIGLGKWVSIAREIAGRTPKQCEGRWRSLNPNYKRPRSETSVSIDKRPLKKFKGEPTKLLKEEPFPILLMERNGNISHLDANSTKLNQPFSQEKNQQMTLIHLDSISQLSKARFYGYPIVPQFPQSSFPQLEQPLDAIVLEPLEAEVVDYHA